MQNKYPGLFQLIDQEDEANQYFSSLPAYVQEQMCRRAESINSMASLQDYAENILRGDD
jgi:hypothetical protein